MVREVEYMTVELEDLALAVKRLQHRHHRTLDARCALAGRLEARGLIDRAAGPGRALRHRLTSTGEALLSEGYTVYNEVLSQSFAPLSPTELDTLYDLLTHLLRGPDGPLVE